MDAQLIFYIALRNGELHVIPKYNVCSAENKGIQLNTASNYPADGHFEFVSMLSFSDNSF